MADFNEDTTVAEVAVRYPDAKPVLERMGIDYCCGGDARLADAARESGHTVSEVRDAVEQAAREREGRGEAARDWSRADASELAQHILDTHHVYMKTHLPRIEELFAKVIAAHGERHGEMLRAARHVFLDLQFEIEMHLMKEERVLFPMIRDLEDYRPGSGPLPTGHCGTVEKPVAQMEHEHDNAGGALERLREITSDYALPADACPSFEALYDGLKEMEADLHEHIHLENNILFPRALELEREACGES